MGTRFIEPQKNKKLNIGKVAGAVLLVVLVVVGIYFLVTNNGEENNEEIKTDISQEKPDVIVSEKNIDTVVAEFGGTITERIKEDTCFVSKDGTDYTVYSDGTVITGKVIPWKGEESKPAIDSAGNINIYNAGEFAWVANRVITGEKNFSGVTITLRSHLDLGARKNNEGVWEGNTWTPIVGFLTNDASANTETTDDTVDIVNENLKRFDGVFNGNGFSIRGVKIDSDKNYQGLFGYQSGTITDLTIIASYIKNASESAGILVGLNEGTIRNCKVENVEVNGKEKIGGIIGNAMTNSIIEGCEISNSLINGEKYVGGVVGYINNNVSLQNITNKANVKGEEYVGGIAGITFFGTDLKNVINIADNIEGKEYVGGLIGYSQSQIENSYSNNGIVKGNNYVGGLVGFNYLMGNITDSFNANKVIVTGDNAGGIVGVNNGSVSNCYNKGTIDSTLTENLRIGGVCGQNLSESYINTSYNIGMIDNMNYAGGLVGADFGTISNSFTIDNCLKKDTEDLDYRKTSEEMKNNVLSDLGASFKVDSSNINEGYPILNWQ